MKKVLIPALMIIIVILAGCSSKSEIKSIPLAITPASNPSPSHTPTVVASSPALTSTPVNMYVNEPGINCLLTNFKNAFLNQDSDLIASLAVYPVIEANRENEFSIEDSQTYNTPEKYQIYYHDIFSSTEICQFDISSVTFLKSNKKNSIVNFNINFAAIETDSHESILGKFQIRMIVIRDGENWKYNRITFIGTAKEDNRSFKTRKIFGK